jgi:methyl-accepting chemotaxis protein
MSDDQALAQRLEFMKFDEECRSALRSVKPLIDKELPAALDSFYAQVRKFPEVARLFADASHVERAKGSQLRHWANITSGNYDQDYVRGVRAIGQTHARINLEPRWYIGGYALIAELLVRAAVASLSPRGVLNRQAAKSAGIARAIGALVKSVMLDVDLAISIYIEASDVARRRAEEKQAITAKQQAIVLEALTTALGELAQGVLTVQIAEEFAPEYQKLKDEFNATIAGLHETVQAIVSSTGEVASAAAEISTSTTDLSQRTEEQAASLEQTSSAMQEISETVTKNADNARQANELTSGTREVADRGGQVVAQAVNAMARIEESSQKISDIIGVIDEIARQSNLLALNAAVEAARAGEAGRGFAVVASEVRSLAQRSSQAAKDIKDLILNSSHEVQQGVDLVNRAGLSLNEIVESIKQVAGIVSDIAAASADQATGLEEVNSRTRHWWNRTPRLQRRSRSSQRR